MTNTDRIRALIDNASAAAATIGSILASSSSAHDFANCVECAESAEKSVDVLAFPSPTKSSVDLAILRNRSLHGHLLTLRHTIGAAIEHNDHAIAALRELSDSIEEKAEESDEL